MKKIILLLVIVAGIAGMAAGQLKPYIYTVAGGRVTGNGVAANISLNMPKGVAVDADGNLFVADAANNVVRKIDTSGRATVFASLLPRAADVKYDHSNNDPRDVRDAKVVNPTDIGIDGAGNIYILNEYSQGSKEIRKLDKNGKPLAFIIQNSFPYLGPIYLNAIIVGDGFTSMAVDKTGNIYVADYYGNCVYKYLLTQNGTYTRTNFAGDFVDHFSGYEGDGGQAAGAKLNGPAGIALDKPGNVYILDYSNIVVRKVSPAGIITTIAGTYMQETSTGDGGPATKAKFIHLTGITCDADNNVYIADDFACTVRKIAINGTITRYAGNTPEGSSLGAGYSGDGGKAILAALNKPTGIVFDKSGNLYIADAGNNRIRKVTKTGVISTIAGNGVSNSYSGDGGYAANAKFNTPVAVVKDGRGNTYTAEAENNIIRRIDSNNIVSTYAGNYAKGSGFSGDGGAATDAQLNHPAGLCVDAFNNLYIADQHNNCVRMVNAVTGKISTIAGTGVAGYSGDGSAAVNAQFRGPVGLAIGYNGNLYIADAGNNVVRLYNVATHDVSTAAGNGTAGYSGDYGFATDAQLKYPTGLAVDKTTNDLYIADRTNQYIRRVGYGSGIINTVAGMGNAGYNGDTIADANNAKLSYPLSLTFYQGNLYIADQYNNVIRKLTAGGAIQTIGGMYNNANGGYSGDGGLATQALLNTPAGITIDEDGNMLVADQGNNCIRKIIFHPALAKNDTLKASMDGSDPYYLEKDGNSIAAVTPGGNHPVQYDVTTSVTYDSHVNTTPSGAPLVQRHYDIRPDSSDAAATANIVLYFSQGDFNNYNAARGSYPSLPTGPDDTANYKNIHVLQYHGAPSSPGHYVGNAVYITPTLVYWDSDQGRWEIGFDVTGFSGFYITTAKLTLPLKLLTFTAARHGTDNNLNWSTANELNTSGFEVQRSVNGQAFEKIGVVAAAPAANGDGSYGFTDKNPEDGALYYRLKMMDKDGRFTFSWIVQVKNDGASLKIYPNPAVNMVKVTIPAVQSLLQVMVYSAHGQLVKTVRAVNVQTLDIDMAGLANGVYQLQIVSGGKAVAQKVVVQH